MKQCKKLKDFERQNFMLLGNKQVLSDILLKKKKNAVIIVLKYLKLSLMHAAEQKRRHYKYRCQNSW